MAQEHSSSFEASLLRPLLRRLEIDLGLERGRLSEDETVRERVRATLLEGVPGEDEEARCDESVPVLDDESLRERLRERIAHAVRVAAELSGTGRTVPREALREERWLDLALTELGPRLSAALRRRETNPATGSDLDPAEDLTTDSDAIDSMSLLEEPGSEDALSPGMLLAGKYRIVRKIGAGGFASVFEARDEVLEHRVAIKCLHSRATSLSDPTVLIAEARRVTRLDHPNIVDWKFFDVTDDGIYYFVMEYLEGDSLEAVLEKEGRLPASRTGAILLEILDALRGAHHLPDGESILHLDLKPQHVFLQTTSSSKRERVKVIDFGLGQYVGTSIPESVTPKSGPRFSSLTVDSFPVPSREEEERLLELARDRMDRDAAADGVSGSRPGGRSGTESSGEPLRCHACTPEFASPEQCAHMLPTRDIVPLDGRSDLYSLGVLGFQMLTGELPFERPGDRREWLRLHLEKEPRKLASMGVRAPRGLIQFIDRCLLKDRSRRFASSEEAFSFLAEGLRPSRRAQLIRVGIPVLAGMILFFVAVFRWLASPERPAFVLRTEEGRVLGTEESYYFGAGDLSEARLSVDGLPGGASGPVEFVSRRDGGASPLEGWAGRLVEEGRLVLRRISSADGEDGPVVRQTGWLRYSQMDDHWFSEPLELIELPPTSWGFRFCGVQALGDRKLDPRGQTLFVGIDVQHEDHLDPGLRATWEEGPLPVKLRGIKPNPPHTTFEYEVDLGDLERADGERVEVVVLARDRAGFSKTERVELSLATGELEIRSAEVSGLAGGYIQDWRNARLSVEANREIDLEFRVLPEKGEPIPGGTEKRRTSFDLSLEELGEKLPDPFAGVLEVLWNEESYVAHGDPEWARGEVSIPFSYSTELPMVSVHCGDGSSSPTEVTEDRVSVAVRDPWLEVRLADDSVPALVWIEVSGSSAPTVSAPIHLSPEGRRTHRRRLVFRADGSFEVTLISGRAGVGERDSKRGLTKKLLLRVDTEPPRVVLEPPPAEDLVFRDEASRPSFGFRVEDEGSSRGGESGKKPLELSFRLSREGEGSIPLSETGISFPERGFDSRSLALPIPRLDPEPDGTYRLAISARDSAGHIGLGEIEWHVARDGPRLDLLNPRGGGSEATWFQAAGSDGAFLLHVRALDGNGVKRVRGEIRSMDGDRAPLLLSPEDEAGTLWSGEVRFERNWSGKAVEIELDGEDEFGNRKRSDRFLVRLEQFAERLPRRISVVRPGEDFSIGPMARVEGNTAPYVFGGRPDRDENRLLSALGLKPISEGAARRAWRLRCDPGSIEEFYLDLDEVSEAEFWEFLRAESGYLDPGNWGGEAPLAPAAARWEGRLSRGSSRPVIGVTWDEAVAYARWVGKRLPGRVEWEYAFRNGSDYRPYPHYEKGGRYVLGAINADSVSARPWKRGEGEDVSAAGVWNLAGNVREWTLSPYGTRVEAQRDLPGFLAPWKRRDLVRERRFWVVGGAFDLPVFDFFTAGGKLRGQREANLGFRCAVSAEVVEDDLYRKAPPERRFHGLE